MSHSSELDGNLASKLLACSDCGDFSIVYGDTMCTSDFYEGQLLSYITCFGFDARPRSKFRRAYFVEHFVSHFVLLLSNDKAKAMINVFTNYFLKKIQSKPTFNSV